MPSTTAICSSATTCCAAVAPPTSISVASKTISSQTSSSTTMTSPCVSSRCSSTTSPIAPLPRPQPTSPTHLSTLVFGKHRPVFCRHCFRLPLLSPLLYVAIALKKSSHLGRGTHVPRSGYACTSVGVRMYLGRGTHLPRSQDDDLTVPFAQLSASFQITNEPSRTDPLRGFKRQ